MNLPARSKYSTGSIAASPPVERRGRAVRLDAATIRAPLARKARRDAASRDLDISVSSIGSIAGRQGPCPSGDRPGDRGIISHQRGTKKYPGLIAGGLTY